MSSDKGEDQVRWNSWRVSKIILEPVIACLHIHAIMSVIFVVYFFQLSYFYYRRLSCIYLHTNINNFIRTNICAISNILCALWPLLHFLSFIVR